MNEYNTKITYYKEGNLDFKRTFIAYSKFFAAQRAKIAINHLKTRIYSERLSQPINQS